MYDYSIKNEVFPQQFIGNNLTRLVLPYFKQNNSFHSSGIANGKLKNVTNFANLPYINQFEMKFF